MTPGLFILVALEDNGTTYPEPGVIKYLPRLTYSGRRASMWQPFVTSGPPTAARRARLKRKTAEVTISKAPAPKSPTWT